MRYRIHLRASLVVLSIYERIWEPPERIGANPFFLLYAELLIKFKELDDSFKLCKE